MDPSIQHTLDHIPTLQALEGKFRKLRRSKASGPDQLPGELFIAAPTDAARTFYGLTMKVAAFGSDPLQWRGGIVKAIYKKGATDQAHNWRNILLSSVPGKATHSLIRDALNRCYQQAAHEGQFGGKTGANISVPTMGVRSFQHWCKSTCRSYALIFIDGIEAFYRLVRELCFSYSDPDAFGQVLDRTHASQHLKQLILENAKALSALERANASSHLVAVTRALHQLTWFVVDQETQGVVVTTRGSRPGDPIAGVLFNLVMGRAMSQIDLRLKENGLRETLGLDESQPLPLRCRGFSSVDFSGQAWVDDLIYMKSSDDPATLCEQVQQIVAIVQSELATFGIDMNLAKGKSEVMIHLAGQGSRQLRRQLLVEAGSQLRFVDVDGQSRTLSVGHKYKYLGSVLSIQGSCQVDIKNRAAQTFAALKTIRRHVLRNRDLSAKSRQQIIHSIVISKMMATSGSWILDTKQAVQCFHKTMMRIYRYIFSQLPGWDKTRNYSHEEIISTLGTLWPSELLHVHRLRGLIAATTSGTLHIWAILQADKQWLNHIQEALIWLSWQTSMDVTGESPPMETQSFIDLVETHPHRARRLLRRGQIAALNMRIRENNAHLWHIKYSAMLTDIGFTSTEVIDVADSQDEAAQEGFLCPICAKHFSTPHGAATHLMRAHQIHAEHYLWANRTSCLCCMQEFHSTRRLSAHFQHGGVRCLEQLKLRYHDPHTLADDHRKENMEHVPFIAVAGPVEQWCQQMADEHRGWIHKPRRARRPPMMARTRGTDPPLRGSAFPTQLDVSNVHMPRHIPMPTQFILHFFSGRRREGDLQCHLEEQASSSGFYIRVLSLDVAIDGTLGNLSTEHAYAFWIDKSLRGYIHSFVTGPPCETFTRARFRAGGPPPLRSKTYRWGLPGLVGRHHHQVESGSVLWRFEPPASRFLV